MYVFFLFYVPPLPHDFSYTSRFSSTSKCIFNSILGKDIAFINRLQAWKKKLGNFVAFNLND